MSRSRQALGARAKVENVRRLPRRKLLAERVRLQLLQETDPVDLEARPRTRADCIDGPRPCPWVGCKYNTFLDVTDIGSIKYNYADREPDEVPPQFSCALDIADLGGATLDDLAGPLNVTRERMRQLEAIASKKVKLHARTLREFCDAPDEASRCSPTASSVFGRGKRGGA